MEIAIRYVTHFEYATPVWESHNSLRACPFDGFGQTLESYWVDVVPGVPVYWYIDNWGTRVDTFDVPQDHHELIITASSTVVTSAPALPMTASLDETATTQYRDQNWPFLQPSRHVRWGPQHLEAARTAVDGASDLVAAVKSVEDAVRSRIAYVTGATQIGIDLDQIWTEGMGVCQDYAHLMAGMLRSVGIACRYVSGYFYASDPTNSSSSDTDEIVVATHAWVEVAVPQWGWWAIDPTNGSPVGERHVKIGHGRDYDDVTPLRGVYYGESDHRLAAEVTMSTRQIVNETIPAVSGEGVSVQQ